MTNRSIVTVLDTAFSEVQGLEKIVGLYTDYTVNLLILEHTYTGRVGWDFLSVFDFQSLVLICVVAINQDDILV